ncbi:MAG: ABC-2 family transporter protein [Planctomycetota bacterium]|nr:ABC-2 family transporter protein [Planctomycetota bacterium]
MSVAIEPEPEDSYELQSPTRKGTWQKYYRVLRVSIAERMTYRADFLLGTFLRMLPMVTTILLWQAIYKGSGQEVLAGFKYREMIAYLLLVHISRMFSSMPGLAAGISREIREGTLKKYLIQPLDLLGYLISYRTAHKITYILMAALPYGIIFYICRHYFDGLPSAPICLAYIISLLLSFLIGFYFEAAVGMVGFWFLEVTSILYIVITLNYFISGQMLPLDLLPPFWAGLLKVMPFQYMAYFPAVVFLGKVQGSELLWGLGLEAFWAIFFAWLARFLYRRGLRHYGAYGG